MYMCAVGRNSHSHGDLWVLVEMGWYGLWSKCAQAQVPLHRWVGGQKRSFFLFLVRSSESDWRPFHWMDGWME